MPRTGFLMRAEVIWHNAKGAGGSCARGSWRSPANPVIRDVHEYCRCFSKGRFDRVVKGEGDIGADSFIDSTLSIREMRPEFATSLRHPTLFPVELPRRFIQLYTYRNEMVFDPLMGSERTAVAAILSDPR